MKKDKNQYEVEIEVESEVEIEPICQIVEADKTEQDDDTTPATTTFFKRNICIVCGNACVFKRLCYSCKKKIPSGFAVDAEDDVIKAVIKQNETAKSEFRKHTGLGTLSLDMEHFIFHIDNGYYYAHDLESFTFYNSQPRVIQRGNGQIQVKSDVFFAFTVRGQPHRVRKLIGGLNCRYTTDGRSVSIEPPMAMLTINDQFNQMLNNEMKILKREMEMRVAQEAAARRNGFR